MRRAWKEVGAGGVGVAAALFLLAGGVRGGVGAALLSRGPAAFVLASDDGDAYDAAAQWQAAGAPITVTPRLAAKWTADTGVMDRWPHGYWLFLAAQYAILDAPARYASALILQALLGAGGVLAAYALARALLAKGGALWAGVAVALSSTGVYLAAGLYAESLYIPLILIGLALAAAGARKRQNPLLAFAGLALGFAEATRPLALPVFVAVFAWCLWPVGATSTRERLKTALSLTAGFALGVAPFVAHDLVVLGRVTTFTVGAAEAFGDLRAGAANSPIERLTLLFVSGGWAPVGEPLVSLLGGAAGAVRAGEALLGLAGLVWLVRPGARNPELGWLLLVATLAILVPPLVLGLPLVRYRAVADPLTIVASVAILEAAWLGMRRPRPQVRTQPV